MSKDKMDEMLESTFGDDLTNSLANVTPLPTNPGRPKRSKNKNSQLARDRLEHYQLEYADFVGPLDMLLLTMNGRNSDGEYVDVEIDVKINCAKAAMPYIHPKLTSIEVEEKDDEEMTLSEKASRVEELMKNPAVRKAFGVDK